MWALPLDTPAAALNDLLEVVSRATHEAGLHVLQGFRFASTDAGHAAVLLGFMAPAQGDVILDAGCGFGEVARLMRAVRPDLAFVLLNRCTAQMRHAPRGESFRPVLGDMHAVPLAAASVDGVMFNYALCHADQPVALAEAARVTKPGGWLFLYELERLAGDNALMEAALCARAYRHAETLAMCEAAGWVADFYLAPAGDDTVMRSLFGADASLHAAIFKDLRAVVWKLTRKEIAA